jgi:hypothetical protein
MVYDCQARRYPVMADNKVEKEKGPRDFGDQLMMLIEKKRIPGRGGGHVFGQDMLKIF